MLVIPARWSFRSSGPFYIDKIVYRSTISVSKTVVTLINQPTEGKAVSKKSKNDILVELLLLDEGIEFNKKREEFQIGGKKKLHLSNIKLTGRDLRGWKLDNLVVNNVSFNGCNVHGVDFEGSVFNKNVTFWEADLGKKTSFKKCDLTGASFAKKVRKKAGKKKVVTKKAKGLGKANWKGATNAPSLVEKYL